MKKRILKGLTGIVLSTALLSPLTGCESRREKQERLQKEQEQKKKLYRYVWKDYDTMISFLQKKTNYGQTQLTPRPNTQIVYIGPAQPDYDFSYAQTLATAAGFTMNPVWNPQPKQETKKQATKNKSQQIRQQNNLTQQYKAKTLANLTEAQFDAALRKDLIKTIKQGMKYGYLKMQGPIIQNERRPHIHLRSKWNKSYVIRREPYVPGHPHALGRIILLKIRPHEIFAANKKAEELYRILTHNLPNSSS